LSHLGEWGTVASHSPFPFLSYFALGMLIALGRESGVRCDRRVSIALAIGGLALVLGNGYWHAVDRSQGMLIETVRDLPAAIGMAALLAVSTLGTRSGLGWLSSRPLVFTGRVSYGLYLWQIPMIVWLGGHNLLPGGVLAGAAIVLPLGLAAGALSWFVIERPLVRCASQDRAQIDRAFLWSSFARRQSSGRIGFTASRILADPDARAVPGRRLLSRKD
jgi:peptidoglycan/LPS O-acetylase OafA/YrhL